MRNTNSRDKNSRQTTMDPVENKLMKTAAQPKTNKIQQTGYNRPSSGKRLESQKTLPPKVVKKDYNIQQNMTVSRIHEAKQGLQLLKKKMSAKGMSREKLSSAKQIKEQKPSQKLIDANKMDTTYQNQNSNIPPRKIEKKTSEYEQQVPKKTTPKIPTKKRQTEAPRVQINPKQQEKQHYNQEEQIPIKPKKDFNALLEEELRKEQKQLPGNKSIKPQVDQYPEDDIQLLQCTQGCGRMFSTQALVKHQKICQKVFQNKRKAFDSAAHRAPEVQGFNQPPVATKKPNKNNVTKKPQEVKSEIPKWKLESLQFRARMKQSKGQALSKQEKQATQSDSLMVTCNYCGRKFNKQAGQRHIVFCQTKSKQLPNNKKRR